MGKTFARGGVVVKNSGITIWLTHSLVVMPLDEFFFFFWQCDQSLGPAESDPCLRKKQAHPKWMGEDSEHGKGGNSTVQLSRRVTFMGERIVKMENPL